MFGILVDINQCPINYGICSPANEGARTNLAVAVQ